MIIEFLKFQVAAGMAASFIQKDAEIWTTALAKYPGFLGKEVWINPHDSTEVICIMRWATKEQWQAIPPSELEVIEQEFNAALGNSYKLVESNEYQVQLNQN
ncbi:TIGR03792 family protein [Anabaena sp. 4-3]|uniref:TIGR03792 family protein n=1 Tax=Anabaena sp. 4-3 TaxID=1811979 RepID=UPI00082AD959|nr:TIGR03792 family protein [Anabaena sp. 4-3]